MRFLTLTSSNIKRGSPFTRLKYLLNHWILLSVIGVVFAGPVQAVNREVASLNRTALTGMIDSNGYRGYWEKRRRHRLPDVIITSETYVVYRPAALSPDNVQTIEVFDVHRVQLIGNISSIDLARLQRIALTGTITSEEERQLASRFGLDGLISSENIGWVSNKSGTNIELAFLRQGEDSIILFPGDMAQEDSTIILIEPEYPVLADEPTFWSKTRTLFQMIDPSLTSYVRLDDIDEENVGSTTSTLIVVQPRFRLALEQSRWSLVSHYNLESGEYISGDFEDFLNHELRVDWDYQSSQKNQIDLATVYRNWQNKRVDQAVEDFNSNLTNSFSHESLGFDFSWHHGSKKDRLSSELSFGAEKTDVESDIKDEFGYRVLQTRVAGTGFWRVRRKVTLLLDGLYQNYDYEDREDSEQFRLASGIDFWMLKRVAGRLLLGYQTKRYKTSHEKDQGIVWNADLTWRPRKTTTVNFQSARQLLETYVVDSTIQTGRFGVQQHAQVNLTQSWSPSWGSRFSATYLQRDFDRSREEEEAVQLILSANYKLSPRWTLRGDGAYTKQKAKIANDFNRWTLTFYADMRL